MKIYRLLLFISLLIFFSVKISDACSCDCSEVVIPKRPSDVSSAIFYGRVVDIFPRYFVADGRSNILDQKVVFVIERSWKGIPKNMSTISVVTDTSSCATSYKIGEKYMMYPGKFDGELTINYCSSFCDSSSFRVATIQEAIRVFGTGAPHQPILYISLRLKRQIALLAMIILTVTAPIAIARYNKRRHKTGEIN